MPQVGDDTPAAASINEEIASLYGEIAEASLPCVNSREVPGCNIVAYERCRSGDVLFPVIKCAYYYGYYEGYGVYNHATAKGVRLTNDDPLAMEDGAADVVAGGSFDFLTVTRRDAYHPF